MKAWRLVKPKTVSWENVAIARALQYTTDYYDGKIITEKWAYSAFRMKDIPTDWLEEIKDEPVSAEDAFDRRYAGKRKCGKSEYFLGWEDCEANEQLRHRPQQTFDEWYQNNKNNAHILYSFQFVKFVWNACIKAHNLEGEDGNN